MKQIEGEMVRAMARRQFAQLLAATGAAVAGSAVLGGCSQGGQGGGSAPAPEPAAPQEIVVVDAKGNEFVVPEDVERIAITCNGGTTQEVCIFGGADKIVAEPSMAKFSQLLKMYPQLESVMNAGSFDDLNIEALVSTEPDVALVGVSSDKGNAQISDMGIPLYVMLIGWAAVDTLKQEFLNVGQIVNGEVGLEQAQKLVEHWDDVFTRLDARLAKVPEAERKTVYYLSKADITAANKGDWGREWVAGSGGIFAVPDSSLNGEVTVEQALEWNPDVIVVQKGSDLNELYGNEQVKDMKAIQERQVYSVPIGAFWWDRPCPEATLGFLWLAQTLYPEQMADIDLEAETKAFFKTFYFYDLSDEEYQSFF